MDEIQIDPDARTARIGAGVRWEQVIHEAAAFGLAPLNGSAPFVGAVGYILGGGLGLLARRYGYAADHVRSIDVITADGELHSATPDQDEDLFWGVRGSVGNLGLVTSMEIDLHPVARLYGGSLFFPGEWTPRLLHVYSEWAAAAPDELTSSVALLRLPPLPGVPEHLCGRLVAAVRVAYIGHAEDGETLLRPLRSVGRPLLDSVSDMPYTAIGSIHNEPNTPIPAHQDTTLLGELSPAAIDALLSVSGPEVESPLFVVELRQLGGALARPPQLASAVSHRDAAFTLMAVTPLIPERTAGIEEHTALLLERMAPYSTGGILLNFLTRNGVTPERIRAAYSSETLARLVALKGSYDPENFFRFNHNILRAAACNDDGSAPDS